MLGILLDLSSTTLDIIKHKHKDDPRLCCKAMLLKWLEIDVDATWGKLIDIVENTSL